MDSLATFKMSQMIRLGQHLRRAGTGAASMEDAAATTVRLLYESLGDDQTGARDCALVRFYKTHPFDELEPAQAEFACRVLGDSAPPADMKCLTLLATVGDEDAWSARATSAGHRAIPLPSKQFVNNIPMIAALISQFGFEIDDVLAPDPRFLVDLEQRTYNVFHVQDAAGSPYIPAQTDFVEPYGIRSALGFGGMLPNGELFSVILFSKVSIPPQTAALFKTLSLNVKLSLLPFASGPVFAAP